MVLRLRIAVCVRERAREEITRIVSGYLAGMPDVTYSITVFMSMEELFSELERGVPFHLLVFNASDNHLVVFEAGEPEILAGPLADRQLKHLLDHVLLRCRYGAGRYGIRGKGGLTVVELGEIMYVENVARAPVYHLWNGRIITGACNRGSFEDAVGEISQNAGFVQTHKSFFVNMRFITMLNQSYITLAGNIQIPISRERRRATQEKYREFLAKTGGNPNVI